MGSYEKNIDREEGKAALSRIETLVDADSFSEIGAYCAGANVLTGFAAIDGRQCYVFCQYGAVNSAHARKISQLYKMAVTMGAPVIGILDSDGLEMESGHAVLACYGEIFQIMADASGVIPQFSIILGGCMGTASLIAGLSDFVFATYDTKIFMQSPNTVGEVKRFDENYLFSGKYHYEKSGAVHFAYEDELSCITGFKQFLEFMPSNNLEDTPIIMTNENYLRPTDDMKELDMANQPDMEKIIQNIADNGEFVEVSKGYGTEVTACFARFDGFSTLILANNGLLSMDAIRKMTRLIAFCDAFNIPLVCLTDITGFGADALNGKDMIADAAALAYAWSNATVPKINMIIKNAAGCPSLIFNSKAIGADLVYAWPGVNVGLFDPASGSKVLGGDYTGAGDALLNGYIDDIIDPNQTRKTIIAGIEMLLTKRVFKHPKKHGSICF